MPQKITEIKNYTSSEIKELVVSGDPVQIQAALDNNKLKRKRNKVFEVDHDNKRIVFVATTDTVDRDGERVMPTSFENNMHYYLENPVVCMDIIINEPAVGRMVGHVVMKDKVTMEVEYAVGIGHS